MNNVFLDLFRLGVLEEVDRLKEASTKMEVFGKNEYDNFKKNIEKKTKALDEWEGAVLRENSGWRMNELNNTLPNLHRYSFIILFHSFVENTLVDICERVSVKQISQIYKFNKPDSKILENVNQYLMKITDGNFPDDNIMWKDIYNIRMVRNKIVHCSGEVKKKNRRCVSFIKKSKYLGLENALEECYDFTNHESLKINVKPGFLAYYINVIGHLFEDVFKAIDGKKANVIPINFRK